MTSPRAGSEVRTICFGAIDRSGTWWTGQSFDDLAEYLRGLGVEGYGIDEVRECRCVQCDGMPIATRSGG